MLTHTACTQIYTPTHAYTLTHSHIYTCTQIHTHIHMHTHTGTYIYMHTHAYTHVHAHTYIHTHTDSYMHHINTKLNVQYFSISVSQIVPREHSLHPVCAGQCGCPHGWTFTASVYKLPAGPDSRLLGAPAKPLTREAISERLFASR